MSYEMRRMIKEAYKDLEDWRSIVREITKIRGPLSNDQLAILDEREIEYKRKIRKLHKRSIKEDSEPEWRCYYGRDDYESRYMMYKLPFIMDADETNEYIKEEWWHVCSPYDCSGQWFTCGISCIPVKELNETIVIHRQGLDV